MNQQALPAEREVEKIVLGICLGQPESLGLVTDQLAPEDFYIEAHQAVFGAIQTLVKAGEHVDYATVAAVLTSRKKLEFVGGYSALVELDSAMPRVIDVDSYIRILQRKSILRQAAQRANLLAESICAGQADITEVEDTQRWLESLSARAQSRTTGPLKLGEYLEPEGRLGSLLGEQGAIVAVPTPWQALNDHLASGGFTPGQFVVIAARPGVGKTALGVNIAIEAARRGHATVIFSLEMSGEDIWRRAISHVGGVTAGRITRGQMTFDQQSAVRQAMQALDERPIWIDDNPAMTVGRIVTTVERQRARGFPVGCVMVDYLQLLTLGGRGRRTRVEEVTEISRQMKLAAKRLKIPVIVMCQINRESVKANEEPELHHVRESGCLSVATSNIFAPSGVLCGTISRMNTYSLNNAGSVVSRVSKPIPNGEKPMIRVVLSSGRFIDCTPNHPILTDVGFVAAEDITRDMSVAAVRRIPEPTGTRYIPEAKWIGWMLGNGSMRGYSSPTFICSCEDVAKAFCEKTEELFGLKARVHRHASPNVWQYDVTNGRPGIRGNAASTWLKEHALWGNRAKDKTVPDWFTEQADNQSIAEMVAGLWETDGTVTRGQLKFSTTSNQMAWQMIWMLSRLGIFAYINNGEWGTKSTTPTFTIMIANWPDIALFREKVPMIGRKGKSLRDLPTPQKPGSNHGDRLGLWVNEHITAAIRKAGLSWSKAGYRVQGKRISKKDLARVIKTVPGLDHLKPLVSPDIYWDRFDSFSTAEPGEVFDREVIGGPHNFVANGIIVHNSVEQDADTVLMMHQDPKDRAMSIETKSPCPTWLLMRKQRNGPTGKFKLLFDFGLMRLTEA